LVAEPAHAPSEAYRHLEEVTDESALEYLRQARRERIGPELGRAGER
jgi:hypothetical protein